MAPPEKLLARPMDQNRPPRPSAGPAGAGHHVLADVTADFSGISGARPALGRFFGAGDRDGIVLSDELFEREFHRDPHVVGRSVIVDGRAVTVLALRKVFDSSFRRASSFKAAMPGTSKATFRIRSRGSIRRGRRSFSIQLVVAKLKPGVSIERARSELAGIQARIAGEIDGSL